MPYNHLRVLGHSDTLSLDNLDVVKSAENLMLDLELGHHGKLGVLLDPEGLVLEGVLATGCREVDGHRIAAGGLHGQGEDDADAGVAGIGQVIAAAETEGLLVALERLIAGV
jgi:hypothetical protein